jgi:hypothetical protein
VQYLKYFFTTYEAKVYIPNYDSKFMSELSDILYVEDNARDCGNPFLEFTEDMNISGYWVQSLNELETALKKGVKARVYVVDGNFPYETGGAEEKLAKNAIDLIRKMDSQSPKILIFSGDSSIKSLAQELKVDYINKSRSILGMLDYAQKILGNPN